MALHLASNRRRPEILNARYADKRELKIEESLNKILFSIHSSFEKTAKKYESFLSLEVSLFCQWMYSKTKQRVWSQIFLGA